MGDIIKDIGYMAKNPHKGWQLEKVPGMAKREAAKKAAKLSAKEAAALRAEVTAAGVSDLPSDYPPHYYENWKADSGGYSFDEWVYINAKNDPALKDEIQQFRSERDGIPLEQEMLNRTLEDYIYPALDGDKANKANAQAIVDSYQPGMDASRKLVQDMLTTDESGNSALVNREIAHLDEARAIKLAAADEQQATRFAALTEELGSREAALAVLNQERLNAADGQATAINLAQQTEADQIAANAAAQGFIGGSSFQDGQLGRSLITARQGAAGVMDATKVANATDVRSLSDYGATEKRGIIDQAAGLTYNTNDWYGTGKLGYYDADTTRRLANLNTPLLNATAELGLQNTVNDAGWDGLNRSLGALNWWKQDGSAPSATTAPVAEATPSWAAALGPSLVNAGLSIGMNQLNKTKSYTPPDTGTGYNP